MKVTPSELPDVLIIEPNMYEDERGFFYESYNEREFAAQTGISVKFVQDNHSRSQKNVLRGLHYQIRQPQGKLVRVAVGEVYDVAVDLRRRSSTFGKWTANVLSESNRRMLWIPDGFAHGFLVTSTYADLLYKTTSYYSPGDERCIRWNDPLLNINWPQQGKPLLSAKDRRGTSFDKAELPEQESLAPLRRAVIH